MNASASDTGRWHSWLPPLALGLALILGGGGSPAPVPEAILQVSTFAMLGLWLIVHPANAMRTIPRSLQVLVLAVLTVPLVQLLPLPPVIWQALPGRGFERDALALVGAEHDWRAISLVPSRTLAALLAAASALAMLVMTASLPTAARWRMLGVIVAAGIVTLVLGAAQLAGGTASPLYFYGIDAPVLTGFQANRNSTADVLLIAAIAAPALICRLASRGRQGWSKAAVLAGAAGAFAMLAIGIVLTGSRAGAVLLPLVALANLLILRPWLRLSFKMAALGVIAILVAALALSTSPAVSRLAQRFDVTTDLRTDIWQDSLFVARQNAPVGVGMGGFFPAYIASEKLEAIGQSVPNRAHNDYLELAVEASLAGLAVFALCAAVIGRGALAALRRPCDQAHHIQTLFALFALTILALHSLVDYPLRSMALAGLAAACVGLIFPPVPDPLHRVESERSHDTA